MQTNSDLSTWCNPNSVRQLWSTLENHSQWFLFYFFRSAQYLQTWAAPLGNHRSLIVPAVIQVGELSCNEWTGKGFSFQKWISTHSVAKLLTLNIFEAESSETGLGLHIVTPFSVALDSCQKPAKTSTYITSVDCQCFVWWTPDPVVVCQLGLAKFCSPFVSVSNQQARSLQSLIQTLCVLSLFLLETFLWAPT